MKILILSFLLIGSRLAMAIETPQFDSQKVEDEFELRLYRPTLIAETKVEGDFSDSGNKGFRRLANYIFGSNISQSKIAMTAPVTQKEVGEKIAMTAPVGQQKGENSYLVSFTMPSAYTLETLPKPKDPEVVIRQVPSRLVAVIRYSGTWSESRYQDHLLLLKNWIRKQELDIQAEPIFARFDPPWTPWFMRHNEIQLEVAKGPTHP